MATKKQSKINNSIKALVWAIFATHQAFLSWLVITNFDNYFAVLAAVLSFGLSILAIAMVGALVARIFNK